MTEGGGAPVSTLTEDERANIEAWNNVGFGRETVAELLALIDRLDRELVQAEAERDAERARREAEQEQVALVPALVAALRNLVREATCDVGKTRWPPGVEVVRHAQALLAHPVLARLGEKKP